MAIRRMGFTLVELLVVIAIVSILAALLLPALQRARMEAAKVTCLNKLKQLSMMFMCYYDDHGNLPDIYNTNAANNYASEGGSSSIFGTSMPPPGSIFPYVGYEGRTSAARAKGSSNIYACSRSDQTNATGYDWITFGYNYYIGVHGVVANEKYNRLTAHRKPSQTMLLSERSLYGAATLNPWMAGRFQATVGNANFDSYAWISLRHPGIPVAYLDGHGAVLKEPPATTSGTMPTTTNAGGFPAEACTFYLGDIECPH